MAKKQKQTDSFDFNQISKKYGEFTFLGRIVLDPKRPDSNWKEKSQAQTLFKKWVKDNLDWKPDYLGQWKFIGANQSETWGTLSVYFYNSSEQALIRLSDHWSQINVINDVKTILCWKVRFGFWNLVVQSPQDASQLQKGNLKDLQVGYIKIKDFQAETTAAALQKEFMAIKKISALVWRHIDFNHSPVISDANDKIKRLVQWIQDFQTKWLGANAILPWDYWADVVNQSYWSNNISDFNKFVNLALKDKAIYEIVCWGPNNKNIPPAILKFHTTKTN